MHACKQYIWWSCNRFTCTTVHFDRNPYTLSRKVGKGFSDFRFGIFICCFPSVSAASMAVKGLRKEDACSLHQGSLSCTTQQHTDLFPGCGATHAASVFYLRLVGQSLLLPYQDCLRLSHTCFCFAVCLPIFSIWDNFRFCNWFCCLGFVVVVFCLNLFFVRNLQVIEVVHQIRELFSVTALSTICQLCLYIMLFLMCGCMWGDKTTERDHSCHTVPTGWMEDSASSSINSVPLQQFEDTHLVRAGLFWWFHNLPDYNMDCRIF